MAPPEPLDKSLAKTLVADSDSDSEPEVSSQSEANKRLITNQAGTDHLFFRLI